MLINDSCNMSCAHCSHFAPLVKEPWFISKEEFEKEVLKLREVFGEHLQRLVLIGGEPLLHPDIFDLIKIAVRVFAGSRTFVKIITNGTLLLPFLARHVSFLKEHNVHVYYSSADGMPQRFRHCLSSMDLPIFKKRVQWTKRILNLKGDSDEVKVFSGCPLQGATCTQYSHGYITPCGTSATVHLFNEYFKSNIPVLSEVGYNLFDSQVTYEGVLAYLRSPCVMCRFCGADNVVFTPWKKSEKTMEEWTA
jgi:hypothetical protein